MSNPRHKGDTKTFDELSYSEQAKSITAQINVIQSAVSAHIRRAKEENREIEKTKIKCVSQLSRLMNRVLSRM
ncbi:MAG: hypothetical protein KAR40_13370 [Candidatus Sabulitectum sp.]|nr:hypothetical protein [Candidatus Sabulitectum sp.]